MLERDGPVLAPDLPRDRSIEDHAAWLGDWTRDAGAERSVYVANSLGCQIAVELAVTQPERVVALVLVGPTTDPSARSLLRQAWRLARDVVREPPSLLAVVALDYARTGPLRTTRWARRMLEHRIEERLPEVRVPTLVVRGARDPIVPRRWAEEVARLVPRGELVELPGAAHAAHFTHPEALRRLVNDLLTRSTQDPG